MGDVPRVLVSSGSQEGSLELPNGDFIPVGNDKWRRWLNNNESFRFESGFAGQDSFTARMHEREGGMYWYAYRKVDGKLRNAYLGKSERLSVERMLEVAARLGNGYASENGATKLGNVVPNPCLTDESERLKAENARLQKELEEERSRLAVYIESCSELTKQKIMWTDCQVLRSKLAGLVEKVESNQRGYKNNGFSQGIKDLKDLSKQC